MNDDQYQGREYLATFFRIIAFFVLTMFLNKPIYAQSRDEAERCLKFLDEIGLSFPIHAKYSQLEVRGAIGPPQLIRDIDRGWVIDQSADYFVFVNDRLISRVYPHSRSSYPCRFDYVETKGDSPLFRVPFEEAVKSYLRTPGRTSTVALNEDEMRYPSVKPELLRLLHLLILQRSEPAVLEEFEAIDFDSIEKNEIWNGVYIGNGNWEEKVKAAFGNYMCNLAFRKWTDSTVSVDECRNLFINLQRALKREKVDADFDALERVIDDLGAWKNEMQAITTRRRIRSDTKDDALAFFMSIGNIPCRDFRESFFDSETTAKLEKAVKTKELMDASKYLVGSNIPSRCVDFQSPVTQCPSVIPIDVLLANLGVPKE